MKRLLTIGVAVALMFCACMVVTGCKPIEQVTKEDLIPETLGAPEGLYLYYDNYRSLTDGAETERLLNDITVDGVTYTTDEYYIEQIEYMTTKKEIFYILGTQKEGVAEKFILWHYNYDTKQSGFMHDFGNYRTFIKLSENYILAHSINDSTNKNVEGVLYDSDLNYIQDGFETYELLSNNILYKYTDTMFHWWKNGRFFFIPINGGRLWSKKVSIGENYAYLFPDYSVYTIDLNTGEYRYTLFEEGELFLEGRKNYFITYTTTTESEYPNFPLRTGCHLWELNELEAKRIYTFPKRYEINFTSYNEKYLNFDTYYAFTDWFDKNRKRKDGKGYYDIEKNQFFDHVYKKISVISENFRIGEYEFYTDYKTYGDWLSPYYCYYLHRIKDGKDEIMQYYFKEEDMSALNPVKFDDIHVR